ncbi:DUF2637 domain-containing protein [Wenjunlia tyrosinilytica]|uniref:DUF2637 domain-containing protein n=1 Tax=Wenjunlia tyrosinilytica TaxID=1544741 RepID=A0A918E0Y2_9ACTN|nr:DUF2637 domain-containing protein [Wenjunlia tyrosinilytica]GGO98653.1 hypothetical protein GCM10012280_63290 [Wenjunlia tyrosinilytica]
MTSPAGLARPAAPPVAERPTGSGPLRAPRAESADVPRPRGIDGREEPGLAAEDRQDTERAPREYARWELWLAVFGVLLGTGVATIGLYSSFGALYDKAALPAAVGGWGWSDPWMLPVGVDSSILAFGIVNLLLIRTRRRLWWVKWVPRGGTVITIYLNWEAANTVPAQLGHAALAALWVVFSEIAAHLYAAHIGEAHGEQRMGRIRLSRWLLNPFATFRIWRLMRLEEMTSYEDALAHHKRWMVYKQRLAAKYESRRWHRKAAQEELAPFQLAKVGLSVEEALAEPLLEEVREQQRLAAAAFQRAEAEIQKVDADVQIRTAQIQAEVKRIRAEGELEIAKAAAERAARAGIQKAEAAFQLAEAERRADIALVQERTRARAQQLAVEAEQRRTQARIDAEKAQVSWRLEQQRLNASAMEEERRALADAALRAAQEEADLKAATARQERQAAEDEAARMKAVEEVAESAARAAEHRARELKAAEEQQHAREEAAASQEREAASLEAAAEYRARVAECEARAVEAAAMARMTQVDWDVQRVAAMIRARGSEAVTTKVIEDELGVSAGTAHDRKQRAVQLLNEMDDTPQQQAV